MTMNINLNSQHSSWIKRGAWALPALYVLVFVIGMPVVNIDRGYTGVNIWFGKPISTRAAGWSIKMPFVKVIEIDNNARTTAISKVESPTHDLQVATIEINSQWSILPGGSLDLYTYFGNEKAIEEALIIPGLLEVQKSISAKYDAYDLQQKAATIADESRIGMSDWLTRSLKLRQLPNHIDMATVLYPHVAFSAEFQAATSEQTQTEQSIGTFENNRTAAVTKAQADKAAKIREAQARAHQIRANADAETAGVIAKAKALKQNPGLLCYLVQQGWNGKMPEVSNGASPLPFAEVCK